jgi:hypothetical protein
VAVIQLLAHRVMNTAANSRHYATAHGDWLAVQISLSRPKKLQVWLGLYSKSVESEDTGQPLTPFVRVLIHHPHLLCHLRVHYDIIHFQNLRRLKMAQILLTLY